MHRKKLIELLKSYHPIDEREIAFKKEMLSFIEMEENCFERTLSKGHMTASAWLLNHDGSRALLLHHAKLDRWFQLGGHADGDSDLLQVALKEAMEESGLEDIHPLSTEIFDIDIHLIPENSKEAAHYHYDVRFLLQATGNNEIKSNHESKALRWIDINPENLPTKSPSVLRMFHKWIKRLDNNFFKSDAFITLKPDEVSSN